MFCNNNTIGMFKMYPKIIIFIMLFKSEFKGFI